MSYVQAPSSNGFQEHGVPGFWPYFQFPGSKEEFRIDDRIFTIDLVGHHSLILGAKALIEVIPLHLVHIHLLESTGILCLEYLNLLE